MGILVGCYHVIFDLNFVKQRPTSVNFSYRFQNFVSRLSTSCVQNPYAQLHYFGGVKAAA